MNPSLLRLLASLILLSAHFLNPSPGVASLNAPEGEWLLHPAFHRYAERIIPTPGVTYLHLHQLAWNPGKAVLNQNRSAVFFFNPAISNPELLALNSIFPELPLPAIYAAYNPSGAYLALACGDNEVWIVPDNGPPFPINDLSSLRCTGENKINSIAFRPGDNRLWIAASWGFAVADPSSRKTEGIFFTDSPLDWVAPVGDTVVAVSGGRAYTAGDTGRPKASLCQLPLALPVAPSWIADESGLKNILSPITLSGKSFAFLAPRIEAPEQYALFAATLDDGKWRVKRILDANVSTTLSSINSPAYANIIPNDKGYYIDTQSGHFQLLSGNDPSDSEPALGILDSTLLHKIQPAPGDKYQSASWNMEDFIFHKEPYGFYTRSITAGNWSEPSPFVEFNGPSSPLSTAMTWHPRHGLLVINPSNSNVFPQTDTQTPLLICALRNGKWQDLSPIRNLSPDWHDRMLTHSVLSYVYPLKDPSGLAIDPADPDHAFCGSMLGGWTRINLSNPSETPLHAGNPKDPARFTDGFVQAYPTQSAWSLLCPFRNPGFDADGRLWMLFINNDLKGVKCRPAQIHYYEPSDLRALREGGAEFIPTRFLTAKLHMPLSNSAVFLTLSHPDNANLLIIAPGGYDNPVYIIDHNGTPGDDSDDRTAVLRTLRDPAGNSITFHKVTALWEDPSTGMLWVAGDCGAFAVDPVAAFNDNSTALRPAMNAAGFNGSHASDLQSQQINAFCPTPDGRLWIGTDLGGIFILSKDRKSVESLVTSANSHLPANRIFGICHNPDRNSVMISTDQGLAEFFPKWLSDNYEAGANVKVSPEILRPDFPGAFNVSGLQPDAVFTVTAPDGTVAATIKADGNGCTQWEARDAAGLRMTPGLYILKSKDNKDTAALRIL